VNVAAQRRDPDSFLNWMAAMIRLRKECPEIGWGRCRILETGLPSVLAMQYTWRGNTVLTVHNFAEQPHELVLDSESLGGERLSDLVRQEELTAVEDGLVRIRLEALAYRWFRLGGLDYAVRRERE
jgi:maltose alpha-D-glucosyltransferase / alpha-amylase